jgi:hypothetical protein
MPETMAILRLLTRGLARGRNAAVTLAELLHGLQAWAVGKCKRPAKT